MDEVTIAICYQEGTLDMMRVCLSAIKRHTKRQHRILLITKIPGGGQDELNTILDEFGLNQTNLYLVGSSESLLIGRPHGFMLDYAMEGIDSKYVLTLDSDCFPVADGWLTELVEMMKPDVACAGILHPWKPPPEMEKNMLEYRVRSQHCWETTHVACQLVRRDFLISQKLQYVTGDDTGLDIPKRAKEIGMKVVGWMPSRCANPRNSTFEAEFNRYVCLIWGDRVYHHGGYTRKSVFNDDETFNENFGWVLELLLAYEGAEFLLDDGNSHQFSLDREEEVAKEKMQRLFGLKQDRMSG